MRAIRYAFQNARGNKFIRNGKDKAIVDITFGDGHALHWEKGRGKGDKPMFQIDGGKPLYPGQSLPPEVEALGVRSILAGGRDLWPQFAPQVTGQYFLIDQPGSVLAEAIADVDRVSQLNQALRDSESDKRQAVSELRVRRADKESLGHDLLRYDGLDERAGAISALEKDAEKVKKIERVVTGLAEMKARLDKSRQALTALAPIQGVEVPEGEGLEATLADLGALTVLRTRLGDAQNRAKRYGEAGKVKVPEDGDIGATWGDLEALTGLIRRLDAARGTVALFEGLDAPEVDSTRTEKTLAAMGILVNLYSSLTSDWSALSGIELELERAEVTLKKAEEEFASALEEMGQCPLCGSDLHGREAHP